MTRNRASAKAAGTNMETSVAQFLADRLNSDFIERRRLGGGKDRGDIGGVRTIAGGRVVVEVKDYAGTVKVKPWLDEAAVEAGNDDAVAGVVVFKRSGIGYKSAADHGVMMTLETLCVLLEGGVTTGPVVVADPHRVEQP